ncbi:MAG: glycosyltransferase family 4 protein [Bacteroidia bacterium]|nr:glycosyltransferase family 4 protein [Bacteroidia bacterium]NND51904.1 glycosyltransferase [Flavobacteriaceae bacterium]
MTSLKIAIVLGKFPSVSETFIVNQMVFLKQQRHAIDILCLGELNKEDRSNVLINEYKLMDNAYELKWQSMMPTNLFQRILKGFSILISSIWKRNFIDFISSLNPLKYKRTALNFNQLYQVYFNNWMGWKNYDVVHIHFADYAVSLLPNLKRYSKKIVVTFHGYDAHNFSTDYYEQLRKLDQITYTVNTNFLKKKVVNLGFPEDNIMILPASLDTELFSPNPVKNDRFELLFVGRLIELKAPLKAIKIVHRYLSTNPMVHLTIVGEGPEEAACRDYISAHGLEKNVEMFGNRTQNEIVQHLNKTDVFIFPGIIDHNGRCEAQGLVIQEAQAMKVPVVVSDVGGLPEGLIDGESGYVVKSDKIDDYAELLHKLFSDEKLKTSMGERGRLYVKEKYDTQNIGAKLLELYIE